MTRPVWHHSWSGMRGVLGKSRRTWMTWGEFEGSLAIFGIRLTRYQAWQILRTDPPEKVNKVYRYEMKHLSLIREHLIGKDDADGLAAG
jgi:hypothetical protein